MTESYRARYYFHIILRVHIYGTNLLFTSVCFYWSTLLRIHSLKWNFSH